MIAGPGERGADPFGGGRADGGGTGHDPTEHDPTGQVPAARRILLVSADPVVGAVCAEALAGLGIGVTIVRSGVQAVIHARLHRFDALLVDDQLADVRGEEALAWLGAVVSLRARPALFLADSADPPSALAALPVLRKPFSADRLCAVISGLLAQPRREGAERS